jgi:hypothetical protein
LGCIRKGDRHRRSNLFRRLRRIGVIVLERWDGDNLRNGLTDLRYVQRFH